MQSERKIFMFMNLIKSKSMDFATKKFFFILIKLSFFYDHYFLRFKRALNKQLTLLIFFFSTSYLFVNLIELLDIVNKVFGYRIHISL
jgi:hypothetical protein